MDEARKHNHKHAAEGDSPDAFSELVEQLWQHSAEHEGVPAPHAPQNLPSVQQPGFES